MESREKEREAEKEGERLNVIPPQIFLSDYFTMRKKKYSGIL